MLLKVPFMHSRWIVRVQEYQWLEEATLTVSKQKMNWANTANVVAVSQVFGNSKNVL